MQVNEYIRQEMARVRMMVDRTMEGVTKELFNWAPPGSANTISATFAHLMNVEDNIIQKIIQDKASVWERDGWSAKTGIQKPPNIGEDWSEFKHRTIAIQPLHDYKTAVWAATDAYLELLKPEELDRMVTFSRGERSTADLIILSASQSLNHAGEIAVLKGIQGVQGFPH
jgi:hypothetical protein